MQRGLVGQPLFVALVIISAVAMLAIAIFAYFIRDYGTARTFFYSAFVIGVFAVMIGVAMPFARRRRPARSYLVGLLLAYAILPAILAWPFFDALETTRFGTAWLEMISCFTTTGAPIYDDARLSPPLHLWRALVAWLGGLFAWVVAIAVLAPMGLGGFEIQPSVNSRLRPSSVSYTADWGERVYRYTAVFTPIYLSLTVALAILLAMTGQTGFHAAVLAMSTLATSGITAGAPSLGGPIAELAIFGFFVFALSRRSFAPEGYGWRITRWRHDPEIKLSFYLACLITSFLFLRHWLGAIEVDTNDDVLAALKALWGSIFTILSFLTTTGFASAGWDDAQAWSVLPTPGLILGGLAMVGGGVATTAGGVKLLRVYALIKHGEREIEKLSYPTSVALARKSRGRLLSQGARVAWVMFMLFILSLAVIMLALAASGLAFEATLVISVAGLSNTGPLMSFGVENGIDLQNASLWTQAVFMVAMVLGRVETLVFVALLNPAIWRR